MNSEKLLSNLGQIPSYKAQMMEFYKDSSNAGLGNGLGDKYNEIIIKSGVVEDPSGYEVMDDEVLGMHIVKVDMGLTEGAQSALAIAGLQQLNNRFNPQLGVSDQIETILLESKATEAHRDLLTKIEQAKVALEDVALAKSIHDLAAIPGKGPRLAAEAITHIKDTVTEAQHESFTGLVKGSKDLMHENIPSSNVGSEIKANEIPVTSTMERIGEVVNQQVAEFSSYHETMVMSGGPDLQ